MKTPLLLAVLVASALASAAQAGPAVTKPIDKPYTPRPGDLVLLYEHIDFGGKVLPLQHEAMDLVALDFNDMASSFKVRMGWQVTFYEHRDGKGEWFTFNCPSQPIGIKQSDFCELKNLASDIGTGFLCELRPRDATGCPAWWNDRISSVGNFRPADESHPQGRINQGHTD